LNNWSFCTTAMSLLSTVNLAPTFVDNTIFLLVLLRYVCVVIPSIISPIAANHFCLHAYSVQTVFSTVNRARTDAKMRVHDKRLS
jgi:hypothetical protein